MLSLSTMDFFAETAKPAAKGSEVRSGLGAAVKAAPADSSGYLPLQTYCCTTANRRSGPTAEVGRLDLWLPGQPRRLLSSTPFQS
jgi:hypothetical protein